MKRSGPARNPVDIRSLVGRSSGRWVVGLEVVMEVAQDLETARPNKLSVSKQAPSGVALFDLLAG